MKPALGLALLLASAAAPAAAAPGLPAQDCPSAPFSASPVRTAVPKPLQVGAEYPPEIIGIKNGVVAYMMALPIGAQFLYERWLAYDADRALLIAVDTKASERRPPGPGKRLKPSQAYRYVKNGELIRAELVTIIPATAAQARDLACLANRTLQVIDSDNSPDPRDMPPAHYIGAVHLVVDGKLQRKPAPRAKALRAELDAMLAKAMVKYFDP